MVVGSGLLTLLDLHIRTWKWVLIFGVIGTGHGLVLMPLLFGLQAMAPVSDVASSAAMYAFLRTFGQSLGVAVGGAAFQNILSNTLRKNQLDRTIAANAESYIATLNAMPNDSPVRVAVQRAYTKGFQGVFEVMTGISALGLICSLGIAHYSLDRHNNAEQSSEEVSERTKRTSTRDRDGDNSFVKELVPERKVTFLALEPDVTSRFEIDLEKLGRH